MTLRFDLDKRAVLVIPGICYEFVTFSLASDTVLPYIRNMGIEMILCVSVFAFTLVLLAAIAVSNLIWWIRARWIDRNEPGKH